MPDKLKDEAQAKCLLGIADATAATFIRFRTGARTRAVLALVDSSNHRFKEKYSQVSVKFYKGDGTTVGSKEYQHYHQSQFTQVAALRHTNIQQSLAGGVAAGVGPYSVMQYVPGDELAPLLDQRNFNTREAESMISQILLEIWIPLWSAGLRFKDCHAGNFVLTPERKVVMIDTEQMRKDVDELLKQPSIWTQRDKHEASGLKRLAGLLTRIVMSAQADACEATVKRHVKDALAESGLLEQLSTLGREPRTHESSTEQARQAVLKTIASVKSCGYLV